MLSAQYFGLGVVLVCLGGLIVWWKDRLLWLFGVLSVVTLLLATSSGPWLAKFPLLKNAYLLHFVLFVYLAVAVVLGSHHRPYSVSDSSTWRERNAAFEWAHVAGGGSLLLVEWSSRRALWWP